MSLENNALLLRYVAAMQRSFPCISVELATPSIEPSLVQLDGWVTITPQEIAVVRHSILGDKVQTVDGYAVEYVALIPGGYWEPDDVDVCPDSEHENPSNAVEAAYMLVLAHRARQALQAEGENLFAEELRSRVVEEVA